MRKLKCPRIEKNWCHPSCYQKGAFGKPEIAFFFLPALVTQPFLVVLCARVRFDVVFLVNCPLCLGSAHCFLPHVLKNVDSIVLVSNLDVALQVCAQFPLCVAEMLKQQ